MKKLKSLVLGIFALTSLTAFPCTGITMRTLDDKIIQGRTIEFGEYDLKSKVVISPRGRNYQSVTPEGKQNGLKWTGKYGYVGLSVITDIFIGEGLNEAGLNAGLFYFPHYGSLTPYNPKEASNSLSDLEFVSWMLSNFATVDEVIEGLKKIKVVNIAYEEDGEPFPTAHWRVADKSGRNIVIEIVNKGQVRIYENKVGVLTNSPDYDWHTKNLNNYINLHPGNADNYNVGNQKLFSFGAGTGALGLPGDITPPSRFIRAFFYLNSAKKSTNGKMAVDQSFHILNNFDIPIGSEYTEEHKSYIPKDLLSATQWTSVINLNDKEIYYKTMNNSQIRKINLNKIDFSKVKFQSFFLDKEGEGIREINIK